MDCDARSVHLRAQERRHREPPSRLPHEQRRTVFQVPARQWAELTDAAFPGNNAASDYRHGSVATELEIARAVHFASREIALPVRYLCWSGVHAPTHRPEALS